MIDTMAGMPTAIHEFGHAVIAHILGLEPQAVRAVCIAEEKGPFWSGKFIPDRNEGNASTQRRIALAGPFAEAKWLAMKRLGEPLTFRTDERWSTLVAPSDSASQLLVDICLVTASGTQSQSIMVLPCDLQRWIEAAGTPDERLNDINWLLNELDKPNVWSTINELAIALLSSRPYVVYELAGNQVFPAFNTTLKRYEN